MGKRFKRFIIFNLWMIVNISNKINTNWNIYYFRFMIWLRITHLIYWKYVNFIKNVYTLTFLIISDFHLYFNTYIINWVSECNLQKLNFIKIYKFLVFDQMLTERMLNTINRLIERIESVYIQNTVKISVLS